MSLDSNEPGDYVYRGDSDYDFFANICGATSMNCGFVFGEAVAIQKDKKGVCTSMLASTLLDTLEGRYDAGS
jgi:hypothetical protein